MAADLPKPDPAAAIAAIRDARPPATDRFTYLTILEANLCVEVLPALNEILQDAELTQEIGWDLVFNLVNLPGSETCLETIARLGNPREVILKVLETLELLHIDSQNGDDGEEPPTAASVTKETKFITLLGMLAILHKRIKTRYPSRFLAQTLQTVHNTYLPNQSMTASVINLVHSLSGRRRPALPSRKSSINVANPDQDGDASKNAPDPEADKEDGEDPAENAMQQKLLLSFATCILEIYTSAHDLAWAARLLEFYIPERLVPRRQTLMAAFREEQELLERDAIVGQLVALITDLGLSSYTTGFLKKLTDGPISNNPLSVESPRGPDGIALSTGGCISLIAYWVFSATIFDANQQPRPQINLFPEHLALLEKFLSDDPETQIDKSLGTIEALVTIGLWLQSNDRIYAAPSTTPVGKPKSTDDSTSDFMKYVHLTTLIALYHPRIHVRNAASTLAGLVLHADPSEEDRLRILYDLLENCMFASLKAQAITWLRKEIIAASASKTPAQQPASSPEADTITPPTPTASIFTTSQAIETVQYVVFPNLNSLRTQDAAELVEFLGQNTPFVLQAVNFGLFLWGGAGKWAHVLPDNADATVKERWLEPLVDALDRVQKSIEGGELEGEELGSLRFDLDVLGERLRRLEIAEGFKAAETT
ncbi:YAP-binding/ALF4/Glomulin [Lasiosphaeria hispida]|uniref:YAP-binding/ALF4/Glomulin n=1 Tax=Lasiosphaeria hispida TaxID=260671 RepID=A0AAJ0HMJ3_9PEZI|nr:YAP-binding/ALF4/Glomulin [Lasiosphaeria hispida]